MAQKKGTNKNGISKGGMVAIGAGLAAVGAGAYYMLGPDGKKNQAKAKKMLDVVEKEIAAKARPFLKKETKQVKKVISKATKTVSKLTQTKKKAKK